MPRSSHWDRDNDPLLPLSSTLHFWLNTWPLAYKLHFPASFVTRCGQRPVLANRIWEPLLGLPLKASVVCSSILFPPFPQLECQCGNEQAFATQIKTTPTRTVEQRDGIEQNWIPEWPCAAELSHQPRLPPTSALLQEREIKWYLELPYVNCSVWGSLHSKFLIIYLRGSFPESSVWSPVVTLAAMHPWAVPATSVHVILSLMDDKILEVKATQISSVMSPREISSVLPVHGSHVGWRIHGGSHSKSVFRRKTNYDSSIKVHMQPGTRKNETDK